MRTVRTTMRPDVEIEVGDAEYLDLKRQGLLVGDNTPLPDASAPVARKSAPAATSKEG
jgi:hypothetical protein